ncbi:AAA family ATPase [Pseudorhodoferax sp.]|uniref:AAA family ATPase n=1 Tax=Pseudorhodoferax sp. TaxID=1993553 RepID=UPI002DD6ACEF|nr:AAA family ATPase [Pseudorhodoferax sp.]
MRLHTLELIRYGRFTGQVLQFPRAACDFHLVVGANEAGKSTLRRAVGELLFGMPHRSDMGFLHPVADLRLGAVIDSSAGRLALHRARGRKPLRTPDDEPMPDGALAEHLGPITAAAFTRMFCLDLTELLAGGQSILDAGDDMGQMLFQSAAGLAGLGALREALAGEAGTLYAPRRSGDRAFYQALDQHQAARQALRGLAVKTPQWQAAHEAKEALQARQQQAAQAYRTLSAARQQLERVRRIAPRVAQLRELQARWQELAGGVVFDDDAARRLADAEVTLAAQQATLDARRHTAATLQAQGAALAADDPVLPLAAAIEALAAQGHACLQHRQKIDAAGHDVQALLRRAAADAAQIGWPADEATLRACVPTPLALKRLATLLQARGALLQAVQSARQGQGRAQAACETLQAHAAPPATAPISPALLQGVQQALQAAQPHRAAAAREPALRAALAQATAQAEAALAALATWRRALPDLAAMALPAEEHLAALKAERAALHAAVQAAGQQRAQATEQARLAALALAQFAAGHGIVTLEDVQRARLRRDGLWQHIKAGQEPLVRGAAALEQAIAEADRLVDHQRDHAAESAHLHTLRQADARDAEAAAARGQDHARALEALATFDTRWAAQAEAMGLPGIALLDTSGWLAQRRAALAAGQLQQARADELEAERAATAAAGAGLRAALAAAGVSGLADAALPALCTRAEQLLAEQQAGRAAAEALARQQADAEAERQHHAEAVRASEAALEDWQARWQAAVAAALPASTAAGGPADAAPLGAGFTPDAARDTIDVATQVLALLGRVDEIRLNRIDTLQREWDAFVTAARALPAVLGAPAQAGSLLAWVQTLTHRLQQARQVERERQRLQAALHGAEAEAGAADAVLAATRASLATLTHLAQSDDLAVVRERIEHSDRRRALAADLQRHRQAIVEHGDGLALEALMTEADAVPPETLLSRLDALDTQLADTVEQQRVLASELAQAQAALDRIDGGADAAEAESKRVEALAQMGEAAERYVTVSVGQRLLRWAIDRYRERKQGPLLQRASALFAQLTLGGFTRLLPDLETTPPRLIALRAGGEQVGVDGLSEGTRDQLFLALRLAALELQIEGDRPLPFIADDLFVNFHDSRSRAGLAALGELARRTQVIFLTHHEHLVPVARQVLGPDINVIDLHADLHADTPPTA